MATTHRTFRIKNGEYVLTTKNAQNLDSKSNIKCITCIINNENEDLDYAEKQMYRFDTQAVRFSQVFTPKQVDDIF